MKFSHHLFCAFVLSTLAMGLVPSVAHADIIGFGDFSGFKVNQNDSGNGPTVSNGTILLINGASEDRSIFCKTPQNISQFTASFTYQATGSNYDTEGVCFVLQNSTAGASAVGGQYGYAGFPGKSLAVSLDTNNVSGYYTNGNLGSGSLSTSPVNFKSGDPINVTLTYNGSLLQESLLDTTTSASFSTSYLILTDFPTLLGGTTAYVGLTANSPSYFGTNKSFSNFHFTSTVPEPSALILLGIGAISMLTYVRRRA